MPRSNLPRLSFIGFGEAGQALAQGLREAGLENIAAWDILFTSADGEALRAAAARLGVRQAAGADDAVAGSDIVISAVTAAQSLAAARAVKDGLGGQFFLDINSVSPGRKRQTADMLGAAARYVDVAVMAPVHPARHRTPLLMAGAHAQAALPLLAALGMNAAIAGPEIGAAAAIKMVRSVMIKGMEALTAECFVAAARAGVEDAVIASLAKSFPTLDWNAIIAYNLERMTSHGERRAAEMEEVADTLRELGLEPHMASATVKRQREMGHIGREDTIRAAVGDGRSALLAIISARLRARAQH
ncbi:MAG: DUF1932 domain-containing protein [Proteobacteria bacterium]|nr:DUF1932 domain-containing protein [Pseudomonadota bacterium]